MRKARERAFAEFTTRVGDERRKFCRLRGDNAQLMRAPGLRDSKLALLELAICRAESEWLGIDVRALSALRDWTLPETSDLTAGFVIHCTQNVEVIMMKQIGF